MTYTLQQNAWGMQNVPLLIHIAPLSNINYLTSLLLSHAFRSCRHCYSTRYHQCHLWLRPDCVVLFFPSTGFCSICVFSGSCQASYWLYCLSPLLFKYNCLKQLPKWHQLATDYILRWPSVSFHVIFCELKCFSLQRKPLEVKHRSSRCIWHPLFPWA